MRKLRESLVVEYEKAHFRRNTVFFIPGLILSIGLILLTAALGGGVAIFTGLALAVVLIMTLSELLRQTGGLKGMVESLQALIPNGRFVIAALPALVGLLPMIGGAMFSAPMVEESSRGLDLSRERKRPTSSRCRPTRWGPTPAD